MRSHSAFNSLFEIPRALAHVRRFNETFNSLFEIRSYTDVNVTLAEFYTFNSLFEIQVEEVVNRVAESFDPFNSLFEIPYQRALCPLDDSGLSILFLRFTAHVIGNHHFTSGLSFNSLFEIHAAFLAPHAPVCEPFQFSF